MIFHFGTDNTMLFKHPTQTIIHLHIDKNILVVPKQIQNIWLFGSAALTCVCCLCIYALRQFPCQTVSVSGLCPLLWALINFSQTCEDRCSPILHWNITPPCFKHTPSINNVKLHRVRCVKHVHAVLFWTSC